MNTYILYLTLSSFEAKMMPKNWIIESKQINCNVEPKYSAADFQN